MTFKDFDWSYLVNMHLEKNGRKVFFIPIYAVLIIPTSQMLQDDTKNFLVVFKMNLGGRSKVRDITHEISDMFASYTISPRPSSFHLKQNK